MRKILGIGFVSLFLLACATQPPGKEPGLPLASGLKPRGTVQAEGRRFMISTDGEASTRAGRKMHALGGNAVDAAVAASFTISVERPHSTGVGGGSFFLLHFPKTKQTVAYDFRERAPAKASRDMFLDKEGIPVPRLSLDGGLAVGTPGLVAGLVEVHRRYGSLPLATVLAPAIELAEKGFPVYGSLAAALASRAEVIRKFPSTARIFLRADGETLREGDRLVQKDLAKTLRLIAAKGRDGFYRGPVAKAIVASARRYGGVLSASDLAGYEWKRRDPVRGTYLGYEVASMPPPSSGGVHVIQILNLLERFPLGPLGAGAPINVHLFAKAMQQAFADRAEYLGDRDFVKVPVEGLTSKEYAAKLSPRMETYSAIPSVDVRPGEPLGAEPEHTTHLTVMDGDGNTVSSTQTINGALGSGLVAEGTGVILNNEMDDFSVKPGVANLFGALGGSKNAVAPFKRPLSSMSPTIVFRDGKPVLALGSPSGTRIITCVTQVIVNRLAFNMPLYEAVGTVRYHHQWQPDEIRVDSPGFGADLRADLEARGHKVREENLGCRVAAIESRDGRLIGVADPRGDGISLGEAE